MRPSRLLPTIVCLAVTSAALADDWPQWLGPQRDGVWREQETAEKFPAGGPPVRWRVPVGAGYSTPVIAGGRVYLTDRQLKTGAFNPDDPFDRRSVPGVERVLCFDEKDGKALWHDEYEVPYTVSYAAGPRAAPAVSGGKVYTVGTEGHVRCYDAATGKVIWKDSLKLADDTPTPIWGFSASPLVDGNKLICLADGVNAVAVAFDKDTGKLLWKSLTSREPGYCPPVIYEHGGRRKLILWHPRALAAVDPETGKELWSHPFEAENGLSVAMPRLSGDLLFVSSNYEGSRVLRLDPKDPTKVSLLWKKGGKGRDEANKTLYALMSTPFVREGHVYGVGRDGGLCCVKLDTGEMAWQSYDATTGDAGPTQWGSGFLIARGETGGQFYIFNEKGDLVLADLSPRGYKEISRAHLIDPTNTDARRPVVWSYPAFAGQCVFVRNDKELACFSLADNAPRASR
jgi:outer membrane protein assembly factor BamB